jgi:anthranilate phosphoribosyltransferase
MQAAMNQANREQLIADAANEVRDMVMRGAEFPDATARVLLKPKFRGVTSDELRDMLDAIDAWEQENHDRARFYAAEAA